MGKIYPGSKVEVGGLFARHYDLLLNILTFGGYERLTSIAIETMDIKPGEKIADFGAGTGRNALKMARYLSGSGEIIGLDISDDMLRQFEVNCQDFPNVNCRNLRVDEPLPWENEFDKVFMSFVLHGLPHDVRLRVIDNAYKVLKKGGVFYVLDYGEFGIKELPLYFRIPFRLAECRYAFDFVAKDWERIMMEKGFIDFRTRSFSGGFFQLMSVSKP